MIHLHKNTNLLNIFYILLSVFKKAATATFYVFNDWSSMFIKSFIHDRPYNVYKVPISLDHHP